MSCDWNAKEPSLLPPFDTWPKWAVDLDLELADLIGDVAEELEEEDTPTGRAEIAAYERVRVIISMMVR